MKRIIGPLILAFVVAHVTIPILAQKKYIFTENKMGSPFIIIIVGKDSSSIKNIAQQAFMKVDSLNQILSDYDPKSEVSLLNEAPHNGQKHPVSVGLSEVLQRSQQAAVASHGAFDVTVGAAVKLWRKARKTKQLPPAAEIKEALLNQGYQFVKLKKDTVQYFKNKISLDFGGIAKGYVADIIGKFLESNGYEKYLIDAGGDLCLGEALDSTGWDIGIALPQETEILSQCIRLRRRGIATSGIQYQSVEIDGQTYSHILDPRTGLGLRHQRNVTVIAPDATTADWMATACSVLPVRQAIRLSNRQPGCALLMIEKRGKGFRYWKSRGWKF
jgi:FAD:protein FMN transferase